MASQPVVLLKEETWGPGSEGQSFREVNESLRELRSVVNEQFARQKDILMNLTLQVSEMQLQSGAGRLFRPQVSCDSVPGISKSVDDFATPVTESMDMQAREFQMPAMEASTSLKAGHHATTSRHSSDGIASVRLSPGEAISELPKSSRPGQRESVKSDFYAMQEKVQKSFISAFKEPPLVPGSLCAYRIVNSKTFSAMISGLIFLNLVLLGAEVDASSGLPLDVQLESFYVLNNILVSIFVVEVVLKVSAYKCRGFFSGIDRWWNLFDLLIVLLSVLEIVADLIAQSLSDGNGQFMDISHLRVMRFARLVRALRGIRVIRLLRYISGLRTILFSIVSTMSAVLWTMLLLLMLFFCFAVLLAQIVTDHCRSQADLTCDETLRFLLALGWRVHADAFPLHHRRDQLAKCPGTVERNLSLGCRRLSRVHNYRGLCHSECGDRCLLQYGYRECAGRQGHGCLAADAQARGPSRFVALALQGSPENREHGQLHAVLGDFDSGCVDTLYGHRRRQQRRNHFGRVRLWLYAPSRARERCPDGTLAARGHHHSQGDESDAPLCG